MPFTILWSPKSRTDLDNLHAAIKRDSVTRADDFILKIIESVDQLIEFPESGKVTPEFADPTIRDIVLSPVRIVYQIDWDQNRIGIARVWHSAQKDLRL